MCAGCVCLQKVIQAGWYGSDGGRTKCPENYPKDAPTAICGHISLVELDGQMSYKEALAYWATGDEKYAQNALKIIDSWATVSTFSPCLTTAVSNAQHTVRYSRLCVGD